MRKINLRNMITVIIALVAVVALIGGCIYALLYGVRALENLEVVFINLIDILKQYPAEMTVFAGICILAGSIFNAIKAFISKLLK